MKKKYLIFLMVLLLLSCKVTEKNIIGYYEGNGQMFMLKSDHIFIYLNDNIVRKMTKHDDIDSCLSETKGTWMLKNKKLLINSFDNSFNDTNRIVNISKTETNSKISNFSFRDVLGRSIPFYRNDNERGLYATITDISYSDYDLDLKNQKVFTFYLLDYKPVVFLVKDTVAAKYEITVAPYYKKDLFKQKTFSVRYNSLVDSVTKFKRVTLITDIVSPYFVHGPRHH